MRILLVVVGLLFSCVRLLHAGGLEDFQAAMQTWDQGDVEGAIELMNAALTDPNLPVETKAGIVVYRGMAQSALGNNEAAKADFEYAIEVDPTSVDARTNLGVIFENAGQYDIALRYHQEAYKTSSPKGPSPELISTNNNLAWLLATCPDDQIRDGTVALTHAMSAITMITDYWPDADKTILASSYDTLAASYAEIGNFDQAIATVQKAINTLGDEPHPMESELSDRLESYRAELPWRTAIP